MILYNTYASTYFPKKSEMGNFMNQSRNRFVSILALGTALYMGNTLAQMSPASGRSSCHGDERKANERV